MKKLLAISTACVMLASAASAATLSIQGGDTPNAVPGNFGPLRAADGAVATPGDLSDPLTIFNKPLGSAQKNDGLYVESQYDALITFTYIGYEAGNENSVFRDKNGAEIFNTATTNTGATYQFIIDASPKTLVPFRFATDGALTDGCEFFQNGNGLGRNANRNCSLAFSSIFGDDNHVYALFGDGAGDSDLDDIVMKISVETVPLPAAGWLLIAGMGGLAAMKRRKKA